MKKIYYKHTIIRSSNQDDVEQKINEYVKDARRIDIISLNVIPEPYVMKGYNLPMYIYHISLVYTSNEE